MGKKETAGNTIKKRGEEDEKGSFLILKEEMTVTWNVIRILCQLAPIPKQNKTEQNKQNKRVANTPPPKKTPKLLKILLKVDVSDFQTEVKIRNLFSTSV